MKINLWRVGLGALDTAIVATAAFVAITLYYNGAIPEHSWHALQTIVPIAMAMVLGFNYAFGLYNRVWKYAGLETAAAIGFSVTAALVLAALTSKLLKTPFPILVWYTTWLFALFAICGTRFAWRFIRASLGVLSNGHANNADKTDSRRRVLIYGAGTRGSSILHLVNNQAELIYDIVGFVDDDPRKRSLQLGGYRVLGTGEELPHLAERYGADEIVIAIADLSRSQLQEILLKCRTAGVKATVMPSLLELMDGERLRPRDIDVQDLLGREAPITHVDLHQNYLQGKTVLVTGAGGSIGSELSRLICRHEPEHLILLGRGENRIHWIYLQLTTRYPHLKITPIVHNITVASSMECVFAEYKPQVVFHAAAHKHVYLMETVPAEAVRNNVLGTRQLARLAAEHGVEKFIFISTDKAVSPTSVMGATKRACELLLVNHNHAPTKFVCVRFGNVLGSEGSVLEIFKRQWKNGQPLTVTHQDATRYFMSIPEASFLVMQAGALGEHGEIFLLDMGEPVRISRLAEEFILLNGGNPHDAGAIKTIGLREGEKLHEALMYDDEDVRKTLNPHVMRVCNNCVVLDEKTIEGHLEALERAVAIDDDEETVRILNEFTGGSLRPETYQHSTAI
jgi:FlaA1/EpsC-like NDP-sugar epimerase